MGAAWCLLRLRKFEDAEASLNEAIRYKLYDPDRINAIGTAFVWLGDTERGLRFYDIAKRRMIHNLDFLSTDYGEAYYFQKDYETAIGYLEVGELRNPVRTHILRCATLAQLGRLVEARADAQKAIGVFKDRWKGNEPFSVEKATKWYLAGVPLRRAEDMENLVHGLAKGGFVF